MQETPEKEKTSHCKNRKYAENVGRWRKKRAEKKTMRCKYLYFDCGKYNLFSCCRFIGKFYYWFSFCFELFVARVKTVCKCDSASNRKSYLSCATNMTLFILYWANVLNHPKQLSMISFGEFWPEAMTL